MTISKVRSRNVNVASSLDSQGTRSVPSRGIGRQFAWLFSSRLLGALLQAATFALAARLAGPAEFGVLAATVGVLMAASALADFGVGAYLTRTRAATPDSPHLRGAIAINEWSAAGVGAAAVALLIGLGTQVDIVFLYLAPLGLWIAAEKLCDGLLSLAIADGDTQENTISVLLRRGLALGGFVGGLMLLDSVSLAYSVAAAVASVIGAVAVELRLRARLPKGRAPMRSVLSRSWPFWINTAATQARNLDASAVALFASPAIAGLYALPSRLTSPLRMIPTTLAQVALPSAARQNAKVFKELLRALAVVMSVMAIVLGTVAALAPLMPILLGSAYEPAIVPLQILCAGLLFASLVSFMNSILQGHDRELRVALMAVVTTVYALVAVAVGAGIAGVIGATIGLSSSFLVQALLLLPASIRIVRTYRTN